jgi:hypothetical protein
MMYNCQYCNSHFTSQGGWLLLVVDVDFMKWRVYLILLWKGRGLSLKIIMFSFFLQMDYGNQEQVKN